MYEEKTRWFQIGFLRLSQSGKSVIVGVNNVTDIAYKQAVRSLLEGHTEVVAIKIQRG